MLKKVIFATFLAVGVNQTCDAMFASQHLFDRYGRSYTLDQEHMDNDFWILKPTEAEMGDILQRFGFSDPEIANIILQKFAKHEPTGTLQKFVKKEQKTSSKKFLKFIASQFISTESEGSKRVLVRIMEEESGEISCTYCRKLEVKGMDLVEAAKARLAAIKDVEGHLNQMFDWMVENLQGSRSASERLERLRFLRNMKQGAREEAEELRRTRPEFEAKMAAMAREREYRNHMGIGSGGLASSSQFVYYNSDGTPKY